MGTDQLRQSVDSGLRQSWETLWLQLSYDIQVKETDRSVAVITYPPVGSLELVDRLANQVRAASPSHTEIRSGVMRVFNAPVRPYPFLLPLTGMGVGILLGLIYRLRPSPSSP